MSPMAKDKKRKDHDISSSESEGPQRKKSKSYKSVDMNEEILTRDCVSYDKEEKVKGKIKSRDHETSKYNDKSLEEQEFQHKIKKSKKSAKPSGDEFHKSYENENNNGEVRKTHKLPYMLPSEDELCSSNHENSLASPSPRKTDVSEHVNERTDSFKEFANKRVDQQSLHIVNDSIKDSIRLQSSPSSHTSSISAKLKKPADTDDSESSIDEIRPEKHLKRASEKVQHKKNLQKEKEYREHKFTESDDEEVAKFSSLLTGKLAKKNKIWIIQCPKDMDISELVNQKLNFDGVLKLSDKMHTYEAHSYKDDEPRVTTLAVPSHRNNLQVCNVPVTGNIIVSKCVDVPIESSFQLPILPERVEFPTEALRLRHPLLGRCNSESSESVLHLTDSKNSSQTKKKKKKKDRSSKVENEKPSFLTYESSDIAETDLNTSSLKSQPKKKKKKHKSRNDETTSSPLDNEDLSVCYSKIKKKKKHRSDTN